ncbi:MAG: hypothetical protein MZV64_03205 [Ignavibacteriales bacterium]|nr:hypothetical protein [Ignavibacteriales bacterium]
MPEELARHYHILIKAILILDMLMEKKVLECFGREKANYKQSFEIHH